MGPFMSPKMFRRFLFPWLKAECDAAHAKGKYFIKHTDGNIWPILDMMIEAGIDGWQGIQPRIGMTLPALQERYGGQPVLLGRRGRRYADRRHRSSRWRRRCASPARARREPAGWC